MSKMKIVFRKEVEVDLNAYYPNFPHGLRKQIDDALYGLLGGQRPKRGAGGVPPKNGAAKPSAAGIIMFRRTDKVPKPNTKINALLTNLDKLNGKEHLREDIVKMAVQHKLAKANVIHNLLAHGYLEVVE